jgi:opacity protein-like surface antigen
MLKGMAGLTHRDYGLLFGLCATSAVLVMPSIANGQEGADDGAYIGFSLAPLLFPDNEAGATTVKFDTGVGFSALGGYKLGNLRLEGELAYETVEGTSTADVNADVHIVRFTGGAYFDFDQWALRPYLGGGMGVAGLDTSGGFDGDDTAFTWHGEVGLTIPLTEQLAILPAYRYEWTDTDLGNVDEPLTSNAFRVTLRYQFPAVSRRVYSDRYRTEPMPPSVYPRPYDYNPVYRYHPYDPYYGPHYPSPRPHKPKPVPPEKIERDRCGWEGPGCSPDKKDWEN